MELKTSTNCHALYNLQYHLIMVTEDRCPVINDEIFQTIKAQFKKVLSMHGAVIEEIAYEPDHIHLLMSVPPQECLASLVNSMKSTSSRRVRQEHAEALKRYYWKSVFWSRSYLILSSGGAPVEVIKAYIQEQETP